VDEHIPAVRCVDVFFNVIALKERVAEPLALVADFYQSVSDAFLISRIYVPSPQL
jgi:hypothetical protein